MSELITPQSVFNAAWQKFIVEDEEPAAELDEHKFYQCTYLTEDGRKCAIGLCLPEGHPAQNALCSADVLEENFPELFDDPDGKINDLQLELHDHLMNNRTGEWRLSKEERKARYIKVAKEQGLEIPV